MMFCQYSSNTFLQELDLFPFVITYPNPTWNILIACAFEDHMREVCFNFTMKDDRARFLAFLTSCFLSALGFNVSKMLLKN